MMADAALIEGRRHAPERLGDVCVLGLGVSGRAVADYLLKQPAGRVASLSVFAGRADESSPDAQALTEAGAHVVFGEHVTGSFDLCVASPGIPETSAFYQEARAASAELISEVELAWRESSVDARWVCITGTNGKTTTTAFLAHLLDASGFAAKACGNIGEACIHVVSDDLFGTEEECRCGRARAYVAEVSSYQLASMRDLTPDVGVLLGITPDHLAWHGSFEAYADAKRKMLANIERAGGVAVLDATNDVTRQEVRRLRALPTSEAVTYIPIGAKAGIGVDMREACGSRNAAFLDGAGHLHVAYLEGEYVLIPADALKIKGAHNVVNALAAASAAIALGADGGDVTRALASFQPLEHRIEPVGSVGGVEFYNDSKATNVDATLVALASFPGRSLVVMLGGRDKMGPLDELVEACREHARAVVVYGEAADRFAEAFGDIAPPEVIRRGAFDEAFEAAAHATEPAGVVLLSPACASFDEFSCFEERGQRFKDLVARLARREG